jgi:hypothetical protein
MFPVRPEKFFTKKELSSPSGVGNFGGGILVKCRLSANFPV